MYKFIILSVILGLHTTATNVVLAQSELRCFECENCPGPIKEEDHTIIKCHEGNVILSTTETPTTIIIEEDDSSFNENAERSVERGSSSGEEQQNVVQEEYSEEGESSGEEEMEFVCYTMVVEDSEGKQVTNRGCALKLEFTNDTCALANYENTEYVSCEICEAEICNGANLLAPSLINFFKAVTPLIIILLLTK